MQSACQSCVLCQADRRAGFEGRRALQGGQGGPEVRSEQAEDPTTRSPARAAALRIRSRRAADHHSLLGTDWVQRARTGSLGLLGGSQSRARGQYRGHVCAGALGVPPCCGPSGVKVGGQGPCPGGPREE